MMSETRRIGVVLGTRPEIIKNYSVVKALKSRGVDFHVLHTNQQSINSMQQSLFDELSYKANFVLNRKYTIGLAIDWVCNMIRTLKLDLIITNGDTAASLVGAIAAIYSDVELAHVEAGLRSFDNFMYEERNRIMVDAASHYLFAYTETEKTYLESIPDLRGKIYCVGNTTVDLIEDFKDRLAVRKDNNYAYVTMHRKEFTDSRSSMVEVFSALNEVAKKFKHVIFPMHPRTVAAMKKNNISMNILSSVKVMEPLSVMDSLCYEKYADVILTDSGCIQEEACIFNTPCVTIRENTERPLTVQIGANIVSGLSRTGIMEAVEVQLSSRGKRYPRIYGTPTAGQKIVDIILENSCCFKDHSFSVDLSAKSKTYSHM